MWVESLLGELQNFFTSPSIWYDNMSIVALTASPDCHAHTKHVELKLQFVCDHVLAGQLLVNYLPSVEQPTDILTKPLSHSLFLSLSNELSIIYILLSLRGM